MTNNDSTVFTDEEIYNELENLGITDISPETFVKMKQDLIDMVSSEISDSNHSYSKKNYAASEIDNISLNSLKRSLFHDHSPGANSSSKSYNVSLASKAFPAKNHRFVSKSSQIHYSSTDVSISTNDGLSGSPTLPKIYENKTYLTDLKNRSNEPLYSEDERLEIRYKSLPQLGSQTNKVSCDKSPLSKLKKDKLPEVQNSEEISSGIDSLQIDDSPKMQSLLGDYRRRLINYKVGNRLRQKINNAAARDSDPDVSPRNETSLNSTVIDGKIKRKILRHRDGKPVITEELVDMPNIFSSCYPSSLSTTNSFSSDLSFKSNSSSGSLVGVSPESTPRSTLSNASKIHAAKPPHKKKSDPVAMYNYYKTFWGIFKPPGEKSHQKLRWAIRDKMLDYSL